MTISTKTQEVIDQLRAHAYKHYEHNGWDFLVEAYEDYEIADVIGNATTLRGAIWKIMPTLKMKNEHRAEMKASCEF